MTTTVLWVTVLAASLLSFGLKLAAAEEAANAPAEEAQATDFRNLEVMQALYERL